MTSFLAWFLHGWGNILVALGTPEEEQIQVGSEETPGVDIISKYVDLEVFVEYLVGDDQ